MINKQTVEKIIESARVEEVVGDFVSLKKRGTNLIGNCPFHDEKTPSFHVSPVKGIYKCFGCGKAGNAVNFLMEHEKLTYPEALRVLARRYNIEIAEEAFSQEQIDEQNIRESLFLANAFAQKYYSNYLTETDHGKSVGYSYFVERGFSDEIIKKFQLGFSSDEWDGFSKEAIKEGYSKDILVRAGLIIEKENRVHDRFRSRVLFPVHTLAGRVVAFSARTLSADKNIPKYVNSPETDIYQKRNVLYGLYFAKKGIVDNDNCYLVEGNTDVISLFQAGIQNVVASSGTSLTNDQIRLIKRYTNNITILYDGDSAGIKASFRGIDLILEEGMNVRVVLFPDGEDPDSFARKNSASVITEFIKQNAQDFIAFKTTVLKEDTKNDPIKKAQLIKDLVATIALIPDAITRSVYTKQCSELIDVTEQILVSEINKIRLKKHKTTDEEKEIINDIADADIVHPEQKETANTSFHQERDVIRVMLNYGQHNITIDLPTEENPNNTMKISVVQAIILEMSDREYFSEPCYQRVFNEYKAAFENGDILSEKHFIQHTDSEISTTAIDVLHSQYSISPDWQEKHNIMLIDESHSENHLKNSVLESILKLKAKKLLNLIMLESEKLKEAKADDEIILIMQNITELKKLKIEIDKKFGRVIPS